MTISKYTVVVTDEFQSPYPVKEEHTDIKNDAIGKAKQFATEYPDKKVYISFFRENDGQHGYINSDGADINGRSWTDN